MKISDIKQNLYKLYRDKYGSDPENFMQLPQSGSSRTYFRLSGNMQTVIGVYALNVAENRTFFDFTNGFRSNGIDVPSIINVDDSERFYLIDDLGKKSLFDVFTGNDDIDYETYIYPVIDNLVKIQHNGVEILNSSENAKNRVFSRSMMYSDLNYFKFYFLKISGVEYNDIELDKSFANLLDSLEDIPSNYFMYRDFQSRNILWYEDKPWFIDYQGAMLGPLQYDLASLLFQAKARIPQHVKERALEYYINKVSEYVSIDKDKFRASFYKFVLLRVLQTLGAYGFRGVVERKGHFLQSIPFALENLKWLLENNYVAYDDTYLRTLLLDVAESKMYNHTPITEGKLTVYVNSFSYRKSFPIDWSGNGGGYMFDCRSLHNPGRYIEYKHLTGMDRPVQEFLGKSNDVALFIDNAWDLVNRSVNHYIDRGFNSLQVNFGCTGGQHRRVYCAEKIAEKLKQNNQIIVILRHKEQE
jgi:aminoglycoside/choline kinase family phosphotransferase